MADANVIYVDPRIATAESAEVLTAVGDAGVVLAAVYAIPTAGKAMEGANGLAKFSFAAGSQFGLNAADSRPSGGENRGPRLGNPYLAQDFPAVQNYICTFSNAGVSEVSAVKALFGEISIHGHLPVAIPRIAPRGTGIELPAASVSRGFGRSATCRSIDCEHLD